MFEILKIFLLGILFLLITILINIIGNFLGLASWYDFILNKTNLRIIDIFYLFIIYPFLLGLNSYYLFKLLFN